MKHLKLFEELSIFGKFYKVNYKVINYKANLRGGRTEILSSSESKVYECDQS